MLSRRSRCSATVAVALGAIAACAGSVAQGAALVSINPPAPGTPLPRFAFDGSPVPALHSAGNPDVNLQITSASVTTPLSLTAPGATSLRTGGTRFDNVTFVVTGLAAIAPAEQSGAAINQRLGRPTPTDPVPMLQLFSADPDGANGPEKPTLLLAGIISDANLTALDHLVTSAVLSARILYAGGMLYDPLKSHGIPTAGNLAWSLQDLTNLNTGQHALTINTTTGYLSPFEAAASGVFYAPPGVDISQRPIPEPTAAVIVIAAMPMLLRRRRTPVR